MSVRCEICGTDRKAHRACCHAEFSRLRQKVSRLHDVLDRIEEERDRFARRARNLEERGRVATLVDPWADVEIAAS